MQVVLGCGNKSAMPRLREKRVAPVVAAFLPAPFWSCPACLLCRWRRLRGRREGGTAVTIRMTVAFGRAARVAAGGVFAFPIATARSDSRLPRYSSNAQATLER
jgi:hypothetical protein